MLTSTMRGDPPGALGARPELAVILPAYNEIDGIERTLTRVVGVLSRLNYSSEVIVVDDGSTDGTAARAAACGVRVVSHEMNLGYGAALKTGIRNTASQVIKILDADC